MLQDADLDRITRLVQGNVGRVQLREAVQKIRDEMNPHPAGQKEFNVPRVNGKTLPGMQVRLVLVLEYF